MRLIHQELLRFIGCDSKKISATENFVVDDKVAFVAVAVAAGLSSYCESSARCRQVFYQHDRPIKRFT